MSDLISREDAIDAVIEYWDGYAKPLDSWDVMNQTRAVLETLPSAEAVQGEWIKSKAAKGYVVCSNCNKLTTNINRKKYNYCPFCGARMKGGEDE